MPRTHSRSLTRSQIFSNAGRRQKHSIADKTLPVVALSSAQVRAADTFVVWHPSPRYVKDEKRLSRKGHVRVEKPYSGKWWLKEAVIRQEEYGSMPAQWIE
jgi:hypothetical protein